MPRCARIVWAALAMGALAGCSGGSADSTAGGAGSPDQAVYDFLKAVQTGDDAKAADMLTKLARQKTQELDMVVSPPGSKTASFEIGQVEMVQDVGAYVASTWTDIDAQGQPQSDQIVWVVRKEPEGWRIAGMVTKFLDSKLVLNFEDPEDMLRKQQLAEEEMARRSEAATQQALQKPMGDAAVRH